MSEEPDPIRVLETQITAISDTQKNVKGLIEKAARIQTDLLTAGFQEFSDAMGKPFSALSTAAEQLGELGHNLEIERNRIRNEE
jgi:hypothetical protein